MSVLDRFSESFAVGRRFAPDLVQHRGRLGIVALLSLAFAGVDLLKPWPIQWIFDGALVRVDVSRSPATVVWTGVAAALGLALANAALQYQRTVVVADVGHRVTRGLRYRLFSHLARLSPVFHARHKSGDLLVRLMGDVPMVRTMLVESSVELATRGLLVAGTLVIMLTLDPLLTGALAVSVPLIAGTVRVLSRRLTVAVRKQRTKEGVLADFLHEAIAGTNVIQSLGREGHVVRRFAKSNRRDARAGLKATRIGARLSASVEGCLGVALAGAVGLGSFRVLSGHLTAGELLVFISYVRGMMKPLRSAAKHAEKVAKGTACGRRLLEVLEEDVAVASAPGAPPAPLAPERLTYVGVSYSYDGRPALRGFDCELRRGERTALVGRSGAGKSTVAALAVRLFDPDEGDVLLDGVPLRELELESLRERFALCGQETVLFGESVRENLLLGRPDADDAELAEVLQEVGADRFVGELGGLDAKLGAGGSGLSGGQRKLLSLARALLRRAPVLIVDEPFAGLDRLGVERVDRCLRRAARARIVVAIAHDLDDLDSFDRIVLIDGGRAVAEGRHADLCRDSALYRRVVRGAPVPLAAEGDA